MRSNNFFSEATTGCVLWKKVFLKIFAKFTGKHLKLSLFLIKLQPATLLKNRLWHRCFPVNFKKFLRTPFFIEHLWTTASVFCGGTVLCLSKAAAGRFSHPCLRHVASLAVTQVFYFEFCEIFQNTLFLYRTAPVATSGLSIWVAFSQYFAGFSVSEFSEAAAEGVL